MFIYRIILFSIYNLYSNHLYDITCLNEWPYYGEQEMNSLNGSSSDIDTRGLTQVS